MNKGIIYDVATRHQYRRLIYTIIHLGLYLMRGLLLAKGTDLLSLFAQEVQDKLLEVGPSSSTGGCLILVTY